MIQWVYERASATLKNVVIATDDERIKEAVLAFNGKVSMTSPLHQTGTERCAEALDIFQRNSSIPITHVINIQGDEPLLHKEHLESLMACFREQETKIATLIQTLAHKEDLTNPNAVKVVVDQKFRALYFSRSPIPFLRKGSSDPAGDLHPFYMHIGLYAFRADLLPELVQLPESTLEKAESLEQLRWLENGYSIQTVLTHMPAMGVDTPEDLERIRKLI